MACVFEDIVSYPRVSGRLGKSLDLNITFYQNGVPTDPYNIRRVSIYRSSVAPENLVEVIPVAEPWDLSYPSPLSRETDSDDVVIPGIFHLFWNVPVSGITVPDIFFDVWSFVPENPNIDFTGDLTAGTDPADASALDTLAEQTTQKFWLYNNGFFADSGLETIRIGFESLDSKMMQPEIRTLEVGLTPLPLFDFDYNLIAPLIPLLRGKFSLMTEECELLLDNAPMTIGIKPGAFRSSPFVLQYRFNSSLVLKGSYKYRIDVCMPNGETRVSQMFNLQVS